MKSILRLPDVIERTGLSRSSIYLRIANGTFPTPVKLGGARAAGWPEAEVDQIVSAYISGKGEKDLRRLTKALERKRSQ